MIFITLGTQPCDFSRCLKSIEVLKKNNNIEELFVAQIGHTMYTPINIECHKFVTQEEYSKYIQDARVIISHAGTGALFSAIRERKKTIAVARLKKYGEMVNDHQTEIVKKLSKEGYILDGTYSLEDAWKKLKFFIPRTPDFECNIPQAIGKQIDEWI